MPIAVVSNAIFDLDGTLVDSMAGIDWSAKTAWESVLPGQACPSFGTLIGPPVREMFCQALPEADSDTIGQLERAFREHYDTDGWRKTTVYPGVVETLSLLVKRGVNCYGVTNKPGLATRRILTYCGLDQYFRVFLSPDSRTPPFSSKLEAVHVLLSQYQLDPRCSVLVGDGVDDACAAAASGLIFAAVGGGYGEAHRQAEFPVALVCDKLSDLLELFTAGKP